MVFSLSRLPAVEFGRGVFSRVPALCAQFGSRVLLITGSASFERGEHWTWLQQQWRDAGVQAFHRRIGFEPSPEWVDEIVAELCDESIDVVLAIGGGSGLDAAKAVAGLLRVQRSVYDYLEGVGPQLTYAGPAVPFIAVPTTAGTGSEATKNSVLSKVGEGGFKKSFRSDELMARYAVIDPQLLASCPPALIAANGMDALTQLVESYVSIRANPFTDALALSGIQAVAQGLLTWYREGEAASSAQEQMAYASWLSGITLAQVGLGSVHGLASPLGAYFPIPHGMVCGTLLATATQVNIEAMQARDTHNIGLRKYAEVARQLTGVVEADDNAAHRRLLDLLWEWTEALNLERLAAYQVTRDDFPRVVANARGNSMKTNPIVLTDDEIARILEERL